MAVTIFQSSAPDLTTDAGKIQATISAIDATLIAGARQQLAGYRRLFALINTNQMTLASKAKLDSATIYAAFAADTSTGMTALQLQQAAMLIKSVINFIQPGTIADTTPTVTLTFPT